MQPSYRVTFPVSVPLNNWNKSEYPVRDRQYIVFIQDTLTDTLMDSQLYVHFHLMACWDRFVCTRAVSEQYSLHAPDGTP